VLSAYLITIRVEGGVRIGLNNDDKQVKRTGIINKRYFYN